MERRRLGAAVPRLRMRGLPSHMGRHHGNHPSFTRKPRLMNNENIVLDPAERAYTDFLTQRNDLIEDTKRAIKVQADIARKADAAVARLELQLDNLLNFSK